MPPGARSRRRSGRTRLKLRHPPEPEELQHGGDLAARVSQDVLVADLQPLPRGDGGSRCLEGVHQQLPFKASEKDE